MAAGVADHHEVPAHGQGQAGGRGGPGWGEVVVVVDEVVVEVVVEVEEVVVAEEVESRF